MSTSWPLARSLIADVQKPVANMAEEVHNPSEILPKAITWSIPIGALSGVVFLLPILFTLPDVVTLLQGQFNPEMSIRGPDSYMIISFFRPTNWSDVYVDDGLQGWWFWAGKFLQLCIACCVSD